MTKTEIALFRAELFERAAKMLIGVPVDQPEQAGEAAVKSAAPAAPEAREAREATNEKGRDDDH